MCVTKTGYILISIHKAFRRMVFDVCDKVKKIIFVFVFFVRSINYMMII